MANQEILNYVQTCRGQGFSDDQIRKTLADAGWPAADVEEALSPAPQPAAPVSAPPVTTAPPVQPDPVQPAPVQPQPQPAQPNMIQPATVPNPTPRDVVAPPQGEKKGIGLWVKILGLVIILAIGAGIAYYLLANKPA